MKKEIHRIRVDGRKRRFSNTMHGVMTSFKAVPIRFKNAIRVDADFFKNTQERISVFENTRLRVDGQIRFKNAIRVDADFF